MDCDSFRWWRRCESKQASLSLHGCLQLASPLPIPHTPPLPLSFLNENCTSTSSIISIKSRVGAATLLSVGTYSITLKLANMFGKSAVLTRSVTVVPPVNKPQVRPALIIPGGSLALL